MECFPRNNYAGTRIPRKGNAVGKAPSIPVNENCGVIYLHQLASTIINDLLDNSNYDLTILTIIRLPKAVGGRNDSAVIEQGTKVNGDK